MRAILQKASGVKRACLTCILHAETYQINHECCDEGRNLEFHVRLLLQIERDGNQKKGGRGKTGRATSCNRSPWGTRTRCDAIPRGVLVLNKVGGRIYRDCSRRGGHTNLRECVADCIYGKRIRWGGDGPTEIVGEATRAHRLVIPCVISPRLQVDARLAKLHQRQQALQFQPAPNCFLIPNHVFCPSSSHPPLCCHG